MRAIDDVLKIAKLGELLVKREEPVKEEKTGKKVLWALAIIGAVAAVAAIAYAVYKYLTPDYLDDFDEDFDDDFDDDFYDFDDAEEEKVTAKEESKVE